jgi:hypothetical protein
MKTQIKKAPKNSKPNRVKRARLGTLLGHPAIHVVRAMGKAGWSFEDAQGALKRARIKAAEHTVRVGLMRGRNGQKTIAKVSAKELNSLRLNRR